MKNKDEQNDELITVPRRWFEGLLRNATDAETSFNKYEYGNVVNDRIMGKVAALIGYAKSSESIIDCHDKNSLFK